MNTAPTSGSTPSRTTTRSDDVLPDPGAGGDILSIRGAAKAFGGVRALDGADFAARKGMITGLIGPNGAGKSTLFNVATGVIAPDAGTVVFDDDDVTGHTLEQAARAGMARTFQAPRGFASMTALENLTVVPASRGETLLGGLLHRRSSARATEEKARDILTRLGLDRVVDEPYTSLSGGELRLLEIGRHLMRDIRLLMLDEPTAGVMPSMQDQIAQVVQDLAGADISVLIVEHNLRFVFELATDISVMVRGRVICRGTPEEVQQDDEVIGAYLGDGAPA
jgi:ABC-type branched-subunit amino acid transport system ATPase component